MISTFLSYRMYTADLAKTMARTSSDALVARDAKYYQDNIGKIKSVEEFMDDHRLFSYAMKAHGLEDMTYAKAFMRQVLESDVTDSKSFVRKLVDTRYLDFAKAFNFNTAGDVSPAIVMAQDSGDEAEIIGLYSERRVRQGTAAAEETAYYQSRMNVVRSVDDLIGDPRLFAYALNSVGLDPDIASETTIRNVLTSDLSDPQSFANQLNEPKYRTLAAAFSFAADGSVADGASAQTAKQLTDTIYSNYENTGNGATPAAAAFKTQYYTDRISGLTNVDDLLNDDKLFTYAITAFGLDPILESKVTIRNVLTSDLSDPESFANKQASAGQRAMAAAFNFNIDGSLDAGQLAQSAEQQDNTVDLFFTNYETKAVKAEKLDTDYYKLRVESAATVDDLLNNDRAYEYILDAFGFEPDEVSKTKIRDAMLSDPSNPRSYVNMLRDPRYQALASAFNFGPDGTAQAPRKAQLDSSKLDTIQLYNSRVGGSPSQQRQAKTDNAAYSQIIDGIQNVDDFLGNKGLVGYVLKAYGFEDERVSNDVLRRVLTSDPLDPKSYVNTGQNTRFRDIAMAFNFTSDGLAARATTGQAQDRDELLKTTDLYIRQTMEQTAGEQNDGVRLALYFQRKASTINSPVGILADKALFEVVRTALALPASMAQVDIDKQVDMITKKLDIADFKDPKKLDKFLARFSVMYDLNNPSSGASGTALLFSPPQGNGIDMGLLGSLQSIKFTR